MSTQYYYKQFSLAKDLTVLFQTVQFSISAQFHCQKQFFFQIIQFIISTQFSSIWPVDGTLSGATTSAQSGPGSNGNEGVLCIPQSSSITETSPLFSFIYKTVVGGVLPLQRCSWCILQPQPTGQPDMYNPATIKLWSNSICQTLWNWNNQFYQAPNRSWRRRVLSEPPKQHPTKHHLHGHSPSVLQTIKIR